MSLEDRLTQSFAAVFPDLGAPEIRAATTKSVGEWDSMANINLLCVIEEEFGIEIPGEDLEGLDSFAALLRYLQGRVELR